MRGKSERFWDGAWRCRYVDILLGQMQAKHTNSESFVRRMDVRMTNLKLPSASALQFHIRQSHLISPNLKSCSVGVNGCQYSPPIASLHCGSWIGKYPLTPERLCISLTTAVKECIFRISPKFGRGPSTSLRAYKHLCCLLIFDLIGSDRAWLPVCCAVHIITKLLCVNGC